MADCPTVGGPCTTVDCSFWSIPDEKCTMLPTPATAAQILMSEFLGNADMDNNGEIYGTDFMIDGEGKPPLLIAIENNPEWGFPEKKVLWADFLSEVISPTDPIL